ARIILQPKTQLNFYATETLVREIEQHSNKLMDFSGYSEIEFKRVLSLFTRKIRFINVQLIPKTIYHKSLLLAGDIDIDDTEFVALTEHIKGKLWSGDKILKSGLSKKGWNKFVTTEDLFKIVKSRKGKGISEL